MSDYDRGKFYGKKKFQNTKDGSVNYGRSFYGRRSPNNLSSSSTKQDKDDSNIKQPTILIKPREQAIDETTNNSTGTTATKRIQQKEHELTTVTIAAPSSTSITATTAATTTTSDSQNTSTIKSMTKSVKFLEDSMLICDNIQEFVQENNDFLVVGIIGGPGVGKSTILNLLAHNTVTEDLKKVLFRNSTLSKSDEYSDYVKILTDTLNDSKITNSDHKNEEIFKIQTIDDIENNRNCTRGIDLFITKNRTIFLDCQPIQSISILDELIQCDNKRTNLFNEFIQLENCNEIYNLQLTTFLLSVCHILIVVQDWFFDSNIVRFLHTAEMLKPTHTNPEDELLDHFPHLLLIQNRAKMEDFTPAKFQIIQQTYDLLFDQTKLQKDSNLGLISSRLMNQINEDNCGEQFNIFLIPEYDPSSDCTYSGHPPFEDLIEKLRANILGCIRESLTHYQLTEKTWLAYCTKVWENVKKSSFFVEYTKLMP